MLKKLLNSCLDSHLESKSSWVGEQVGANPSKTIFIADSASSEFRYFTAPSNGTLAVRAANGANAVEIQYVEADASYGCMLILGVGGVSTYLKKGQRCRYLLRPQSGVAVKDFLACFYPSV